jgi:hypothetical protein
MEAINEQEYNRIEVQMPTPHLKIRLVRANQTWFVANRGGFKTTRGIAPYLIDCVTTMPKSTGVITGPSFEHLGDNTLNPLFNALTTDLGFEEGVHYVFGTKPPDDWEKPYIKIASKKYDHMISWWNGCNDILISMAKRGSANGISCQRGIFDEVKLMNQKDLEDVVFNTFRGNEKYFENNPLFMSKFFATDKSADPASIKWILEKRKLNNYDKIDVVISLQIELDKLKEEYNSSGINKRNSLRVQINAIEVRLAKLRSNLIFYVESTHLNTIEVLGQRWYDDKVNSLSPYELKVAIHNEDPTRPEDGFYPDFDENVHCYSDLKDYNPMSPLIIAADYQISVAPICLCQQADIDGKGESLNYIDEVYTLAPDGLEEALEILCNRYIGHINKTIYYVYDRTARPVKSVTQQYNDIVKDVFRKFKWKVIEVYTGKQPDHFQKYTDTKKWLSNPLPGERILINKDKCPKTIISILSSEAESRDNKTRKVKKYEDTNKYPTLDQSETTHFSDVFDMINDAVIKQKKVTKLRFRPGVHFG